MTMKAYEKEYKNMIIIREFSEEGVDEFMIPVIGRKYNLLIKDGDMDVYVDGNLVDSWTITENALICPPVLKARGLFGRMVDKMTWNIIERFEIEDNDLATWFMDRLLFAVLKVMFLKYNKKAKDE